MDRIWHTLRTVWGGWRGGTTTVVLLHRIELEGGRDPLTHTRSHTSSVRSCVRSVYLVVFVCMCLICIVVTQHPAPLLSFDSRPIKRLSASDPIETHTLDHTSTHSHTLPFLFFPYHTYL